LLTTSSLFADGELSIIIDEGDDGVTVQTDPLNPAFVQVLVNGNLDRTLPPILASSVARITVIGSDTENVIDLSTVARASFSFVDPVTGAAMEIDVDGGNGHDTIFASVDFDDSLDGGHGHDTINAALAVGNLSIFGGDGNDTIATGSGNDTIDSGDGDDSVDAGDGDDRVVADDGADVVNGEAGNDTLEGGTGSDLLTGGDGDDLIHGRAGTDSLFGDAGTDRIFGGSHDDLLRGGDGADTINGNGGSDFIDGDNGDDLVNGDNGHDTIYGNTGNDTLSGDAGNDSLEADSGDDVVIGGAGDDTANGAAGNDTVRGNGGSDSLCGGAGVDAVDGGAGGDFIEGYCEFPRSLSIDDVTVNEALADPFGVVATFTVSLSEAFSHEVIADFMVLDGSATSVAADPAMPQPGELDYVTTSGRLTFLPGVTELTIDVIVNGDGLVEPDENFFVVLQNVERAEIADGYGEGLIANDDDPPPPILDLALLLDDTTSFASLGSDLAAQFPTIIQQIQNALPTFSFGVGISRFEDYEANASPFNLNQPIVTTTTPGFDAAIQDALSGRNFPGVGGTTGPESWLEGLSQIATGAGLDGNADGTPLGDGTMVSGLLTTQEMPTGDVPPFSTFVVDPSGRVLAPTQMQPSTVNDGIGFREVDTVNTQEFVRLVVIATDNNMRFRSDEVGNATYVGINGETVDGAMLRAQGDSAGVPLDTAGVPLSGAAMIQATIDELVARDIRVVGLGGASGGGFGNPDPVDDPNGSPRFPLEAFARLTGGINEGAANIPRTFPNGTSEPIAPGDPLYFGFDPNDPVAIADSIVASVLGSIGPVEVSVAPIFVVEGDSGTRQLDIEVRLNRPALQDISIDYNLLGGSATAGDDFVGASGTITFAAGTGSAAGDVSQVISVTLLGDDEFEAVEDFTLQLSSVSSGVSFDPSIQNEPNEQLLQSITVIDDDLPAEAGDHLFGGGSRDTIVGTEGNDLIVGEAGHDILFGRDGDDTIYGGGGNDTLNGEAGNDSLIGNSGADVPVGGEGDDTVLWRGDKDGNDSFTAEVGFDTIEIQGNSSANTFTVGQSGSTLVISGTKRSITLTGDILGFASGAEQVVINGNGGNDVITVNDIHDVGFFVLSINGGAGADRISAAGARVGNVPLLIDGGTGNDIIVGSSGIDSIFGGDGNDLINGGSGNDLINGNDGDDSLSGDAGSDTVFGDLGVDALLGGLGDDLLDGGFGNDYLDGEDGNDSLFGSFGHDLLIGSGGDDQLSGQVDNDTLFGGAGNDTLDGGRSDDTINGNSGDDKIRGDHGNDQIGGDSGNDTIDGGDGDDTIDGESGADGISGGDGDDMIIGGLMRDTLSGGDGNDQLLGGSGNDVIVGGDGDDTLSGNSGADTMGGNLGADTYLSGVPGIVDPLDLIDDNFVLSAAMLAKLDASN